MAQFLGTKSFAKLHTGHSDGCICSWCTALKKVPAVPVNAIPVRPHSAPPSTPVTTIGSETSLLIEPETFVRVPMIEG